MGTGMRNFLTKKEKIDLLKEYEERLKSELKGIEERINDLQKNN